MYIIFIFHTSIWNTIIYTVYMCIYDYLYVYIIYINIFIKYITNDFMVENFMFAYKWNFSSMKTVVTMLPVYSELNNLHLKSCCSGSGNLW